MAAVVFEHWLEKWNERLARQKCHILLLVDNAPSHITKEYSSIKVQYLPPNGTSKMQPLEQGIIHVCKMKYNSIMTDKLCQLMDSEEDITKVKLGFDFITACENIVAAWDYVSIHLIEKCFHKAGFICSILTLPETEPEPPRNIWHNMQQILNAHVPFADYTTAGDAVEMTERLSEVEIVDRVKGRN